MDSRPAPPPQPVVLEGRHALLEPLRIAHAPRLWTGAHYADLWTYMAEGPFPDEAAFTAHIQILVQSQDPLYFTIHSLPGSQPAGYASLMRIDPPNRVLEVGNILFTPALQRSRAATEAMYLLARYVFETLGYRRYEWKCNALNLRSRQAAARFGFIFEGLFRQHRIVKGQNRDTAWFSLLDREWPDRKARFERWLAHTNFDAAGNQIHRLGDV